MTERTLPHLVALALLALAACTGSDADSAAVRPPPDPAGWRLSSGKPPSQAEFAALSATCEVKGGATVSCLTDLGLKPAR